MRFLIFPLLIFSAMCYSQTNTSSDGNWSTGGNWTSGVPASGSFATITNDMTLDTDFTINGGNYTVNNGTIIDNSGGGSFTIDLQGGGNFDIGGNVTIEGNFDFRSNGTTLTIRSGDTLRVGGSYSQRNTSTLNIEAGGALIVDGDYDFRNSGLANIDGNIFVGGSITFRNTATMSGAGNIESSGTITTNNSSDVFGNTGNCDPGPCEEGSSFGLPINLKKLEASYLYSGTIEVSWVTLSEINNHYFEVYYSYDGVSYSLMKKIQGAGNSGEERNYAVIGNVNETEFVYIQLKQTDFDGESETFDPVIVYNSNYNAPESHHLSVYPNPGDGNVLFIEMKNFKPDNYQIHLYDSKGNRILEETVRIDDKNETFEVELLKQRKIVPGNYFIRLSSLETVLMEKHIAY